MPKQKESKQHTAAPEKLKMKDSMKRFLQHCNMKDFSPSDGAAYALQQKFLQNPSTKQHYLVGMSNLLRSKNNHLGMIMEEVDKLNATLGEHKLPYEVVFLALTETRRLNTKNKHSSADGFWQLTPGAVTEVNKYYSPNYHFADVKDPRKSTQIALRYLALLSKQLQKKANDHHFSCDPDSLSKWTRYAYNAGPGRISAKFVKSRGKFSQ